MPFSCRQQAMQLDTRRRFEGGGRKRNLPPLRSPSRTMMHNVLKVFYRLTTANTHFANLKDRIGKNFMPDSTKSSVKGKLNAVFLTLTIKFKFPECLSRKAGSQTLEVRSGFRTSLQSCKAEFRHLSQVTDGASSSASVPGPFPESHRKGSAHLPSSNASLPHSEGGEVSSNTRVTEGHQKALHEP
eukprot:6195101-Amphidinium_carterae.2